tara:strand:- start:20 stop:1039 length:1020 start_codon:yes stop_codon:yes gene_type:complete
MRIDSSGNVGIGTTSLASFSAFARNLVVATSTNTGLSLSGNDSSSNYTGLHFCGGSTVRGYIEQQLGSTGQMLFNNLANGSINFNTNNTERMRIDSSGRLLIGGTTNVSTGGIEGSLQILGTGSDDASVNYARFSNDIHPSFLCFSKSRSGSLGGNTIVQNNDRLGVIAFFGSDGTDLACQAAEIECEVDGSPAGDNMPGKLIFKTTASGTSPSERMRISSNGNIGAPSGSNIYNASDSRVKTNVVNLEKGLSDIKSLRPVSFNWIDGFCDEEKNTLYGFIAQEVQTVDSNLIQDFSQEITVKDTKIENVLRVNEKFMIPMLVKAIQELEAKVAALEAA